VRTLTVSGFADLGPYQALAESLCRTGAALREALAAGA
jgi:hypothetical protein